MLYDLNLHGFSLYPVYGTSAKNTDPDQTLNKAVSTIVIM